MKSLYTEIVSFMIPGIGGLVPGCGHKSHVLVVKMHYFFKYLLLNLGGQFRQTQIDSFDDVPVDSYCTCINRLYCSFPLPLLIFIYSMMELLICKYEPFWQEVNVQYLILRWPLRPMGLLLWLVVYSIMYHCKSTFKLAFLHAV